MIQIEPLEGAYRDIAMRLVRELWGGPMLVTRGNLFDSAGLPGYVALKDREMLGFVLLRMEPDQWEVAAINADPPAKGTGRALMERALREAKAADVNRLWLVTTNDNTDAIRFYQKLGMTLKAVHIGAMGESRRLKPGIPAFGLDGIPIEHEFEFEFSLK